MFSYYDLQDLALRTEQQDAQLRELMRQVANLDSKVIHRPFAPRSPPPPPESQTPPPAPIRIPEIPKPDPTLLRQPPVKNSLIIQHDISSDRYKGGAILDALDYITFRIPNGYSR